MAGGRGRAGGAALGPAGLARVVFGATLIGVGVYGFVSGGLAGVWDPGPKGFDRRLVADLCALVATAAGAGLMWRRSAAFAAGALTLFVLVWTLAFRAPAFTASPATVQESCGEDAVLVAAAWVLFVWSSGPRLSRSLNLVAGSPGLRGARTLYGLALFAFGLAHFAFVMPTASLVPAWLPAHVAWVRFTGGAYLLAGGAVLANVWAAPAASLATLQIGVFTVLVWGPPILSGAASAFQRSEGLVSTVLTVASAVVALSYRDRSVDDGAF